MVISPEPILSMELKFYQQSTLFHQKFDIILYLFICIFNQFFMIFFRQFSFLIISNCDSETSLSVSGNCLRSFSVTISSATKSGILCICSGICRNIYHFFANQYCHYGYPAQQLQNTILESNTFHVCRSCPNFNHFVKHQYILHSSLQPESPKNHIAFYNTTLGKDTIVSYLTFPYRIDS